MDWSKTHKSISNSWVTGLIMFSNSLTNQGCTFLQRCNLNTIVHGIVAETNQLDMTVSQNSSDMGSPLSFEAHWFNNIGPSRTSGRVITSDN